MTLLLYILTGLALIQGLVSLMDGGRNRTYARNYSSPAAPTAGRVTVFCPVRGREAGLETNAVSLLGQDHPDYHVVFIVDSASDPAFDILSSLQGNVSSEVFVAGWATSRGQKVHNLAEAVVRFHDAGEFFVFCDADALFPPGWLGELISALADPKVGASTGYRWYIPPQRRDTTKAGARFASLLRSAWNASVAGYLGPHAHNFVWGGSTAIRRDFFDRANVLDFWSGALSDDYALTRAVRAAGASIVYVPTCLVPSYEPTGWRGLFEFTARQIKITRVYSPGIWRVGFFSHTLFSVTFLWLALVVPSEPAAALPWVALYVLASIRADARIEAAKRSIDHPSLEADRWFYRLAPPLVSLLYVYDFLASLGSRKLAWKGIRYTMMGPNQTRVESDRIR